MESQLKLVIRDRKNAMFRKTQAEADIGDAITSLIAICVKVGTNVFDYFIHSQQEHEKVKLNPKNIICPGMSNRHFPTNTQDTDCTK